MSYDRTIVLYNLIIVSYDRTITSCSLVNVFFFWQDYYVADASEEQVFLVVTHNLTTGVSHLYISDVTGSKYSKTLDNIVYYNPDGAHNTSWLRWGEFVWNNCLEYTT